MEVIIAAYDPRWPQRYWEAASAIREAVGNENIVALEHVGSTSVLGLAAKPVIDIQLVIRDFADTPAAASALEPIGYQWHPFVLWTGEIDAERLYLPRNDTQGRRTHHLHIYGPTHPQ